MIKEQSPRCCWTTTSSILYHWLALMGISMQQYLKAHTLCTLVKMFSQSRKGSDYFWKVNTSEGMFVRLPSLMGGAQRTWCIHCAHAKTALLTPLLSQFDKYFQFLISTANPVFFLPQVTLQTKSRHTDHRKGNMEYFLTKGQGEN